MSKSEELPAYIVINLSGHPLTSDQKERIQREMYIEELIELSVHFEPTMPLRPQIDSIALGLTVVDNRTIEMWQAAILPWETPTYRRLIDRKRRCGGTLGCGFLNVRFCSPQSKVTIVDEIGLTLDEWQSKSILLALPGLAPPASALLAYLHGLRGGFPKVAWIGKSPDASCYTVIDIVWLQELRDAARGIRTVGKNGDEL